MSQFLALVYVCVYFFQASPITELVKNLSAMQENPGLVPGSGRFTREGIGYSLQYSWSSLLAQLVKNTSAMRDLDSIPGLGRSPREGSGCPLQYSGLENSMDCIVRGVSKSRM